MQDPCAPFLVAEPSCIDSGLDDGDDEEGSWGVKPRSNDCDFSDNDGTEDEGEEDEEGAKDDDDGEDDEASSQSSEDSLVSDTSSDCTVENHPCPAGVALELFYPAKGDGYVSGFFLPPTIPGFMELPEPSPGEDDADREREKHYLGMLRTFKVRPAYVPETFRAMCERGQKGYSVRPDRILRHGNRPWDRIVMGENPTCAWLRPDVVEPKGWMVYKAQVQDHMQFLLWQSRVRRRQVFEEDLREMEKAIGCDLGDPVLPPEYYDDFPKDYLSDGYSHFMWTQTSCSQKQPFLSFDKDDPNSQGPLTTLAEYILYLTHCFHVKARAVRKTQSGAVEAFKAVLASGILDEPEAITPGTQTSQRNAILRKFVDSTKDWREANLDFMQWWYREKWAGTTMNMLKEIAMHGSLSRKWR